MKVYNRIYLVKDSFGNKTSASCEESSDIIQISGLKNKKDKNVYFESDAYHLKSFCKEENLELKIIDNVLDFDTLWKSVK